MASIFHSITDRTQGVRKSNDWYRRQVSTIASKISASKLMAEGKLFISLVIGIVNKFKQLLVKLHQEVLWDKVNY